MLKNISNLGTTLNKTEQQSISGGRAQSVQSISHGGSCEDFCCAGDPSGGENYNNCMANCDD